MNPMSVAQQLLYAMQLLVQPGSLALLALATAVGVLAGALPGVSTTMAVALLAPMTYTMDPLLGILVLCAIQVASTYGGSISATLLNVPGTPASAATGLEGYPLTRSGEGGSALGFNALQSFLGTLIGTALLLVATPFLARAALRFGPWEYFWLSIFGVVICAYLARTSRLKGLVAGGVGFLLSFVGLDPMWAHPRFTLGNVYLMDGIPLIPAMVGLYGMAEVLDQIGRPGRDPAALERGVRIPWKEVVANLALSVRVSVIGFLIGVLPGLGANIASWVGYDHAMRTSRKPDRFGKGSYEGLAGSEAANNACVPGAYVPLLTLAIPGDNVTAIVLAALQIHGVRVGPTFLVENAHWLYAIAGSMVLAACMFLAVGVLVARPFVAALRAPRPAVMGVVAVLCVVGSYAVNSRHFDVVVMLAFGLVGLAMRRLGYPVAPMILAMVLGREMIDTNFRRALLAGKYSFAPFVTRPISLALVAMLLALLAHDGWKAYRAWRGRIGSAVAAAGTVPAPAAQPSGVAADRGKGG